MSKKDHVLVFEGEMVAKCSCGTWRYVGITAEANASIRKVYQYHLPAKVQKKTGKKKK